MADRDRTALRQELTQELKKARNWILAVGIIMFVVDMIMREVYSNRLTSVWKTRLLVIDLVVLGYFVGLYFFAAYRPKPACVLALIGFWGLHITVAIWSHDPMALVKGILIKIAFTAALIQGLRSASRADQLRAHLEDVFS